MLLDVLLWLSGTYYGVCTVCWLCDISSCHCDDSFYVCKKKKGRHINQPYLFPTSEDSALWLSSFILHSCISANPRPSEREVIESDYILHKVTFKPQVHFFTMIIHWPYCLSSILWLSTMPCWAYDSSQGLMIISNKKILWNYSCFSYFITLLWFNMFL
jgi:hypothetical protein